MEYSSSYTKKTDDEENRTSSSTNPTSLVPNGTTSLSASRGLRMALQDGTVNSENQYEIVPNYALEPVNSLEPVRAIDPISGIEVVNSVEVRQGFGGGSQYSDTLPRALNDQRGMNRTLYLPASQQPSPLAVQDNPKQGMVVVEEVDSAKNGKSVAVPPTSMELLKNVVRVVSLDKPKTSTESRAVGGDSPISPTTYERGGKTPGSMVRNTASVVRSKKIVTVTKIEKDTRSKCRKMCGCIGMSVFCLMFCALAVIAGIACWRPEWLGLDRGEGNIILTRSNTGSSRTVVSSGTVHNLHLPMRLLSSFHAQDNGQVLFREGHLTVLNIDENVFIPSREILSSSRRLQGDDDGEVEETYGHYYLSGSSRQQSSTLVKPPAQPVQSYESEVRTVKETASEDTFINDDDHQLTSEEDAVVRLAAEQQKALLAADQEQEAQRKAAEAAKAQQIAEEATRQAAALQQEAEITRVQEEVSVADAAASQRAEEARLAAEAAKLEQLRVAEEAKKAKAEAERLAAEQEKLKEAQRQKDAAASNGNRPVSMSPEPMQIERLSEIPSETDKLSRQTEANTSGLGKLLEVMSTTSEKLLFSLYERGARITPGPKASSNQPAVIKEYRWSSEEVQTAKTTWRSPPADGWKDGAIMTVTPEGKLSIYEMLFDIQGQRKVVGSASDVAARRVRRLQQTAPGSLGSSFVSGGGNAPYSASIQGEQGKPSKSRSATNVVSEMNSRVKEASDSLLDNTVGIYDDLMGRNDHPSEATLAERMRGRVDRVWDRMGDMISFPTKDEDGDSFVGKYVDRVKNLFRKN